MFFFNFLKRYFCSKNRVIKVEFDLNGSPIPMFLSGLQSHGFRGVVNIAAQPKDNQNRENIY